MNIKELKQFIKDHIETISTLQSDTENDGRAFYGMNCAYINVLNKIEELEKESQNEKCKND